MRELTREEYATRIQDCRWGETPNWLVRDISQATNLTDKQKLDLLKSNNYMFRTYNYSNEETVHTSLRQGLYNIVDMLNKDSEAIIKGNAVARYQGLLDQRLAYSGKKSIQGIVNDSELGNIEITKYVTYIKLSPLGSKYAKELATKGIELGKKELKRLERLRIA